MIGQCMARVALKRGEHRCANAAKHTHHTPQGTLRLCTTHYRVLVHRGHLGSEPETIARWLGHE